MLKNGKVSGEDGIAAKLLKKEGKPLISKLKQFSGKL